MGNVLPIDGDAYRAAMAWSVLRRIRRRQEALRRRWYELSREEVEAELLAIGQELVDAAPLFLPRSFDSGGRATSSNNVNPSSRNGHYHDAAEQGGEESTGGASLPGPVSSAKEHAAETNNLPDERADEWVSAGQRLLHELEQLLAELRGEQPQADASW